MRVNPTGTGSAAQTVASGLESGSKIDQREAGSDEDASCGMPSAEDSWQRYPEVKNRVQGLSRALRYDAALSTIAANYGSCTSAPSSPAAFPHASSPAPSSAFPPLSDGSLQSCASLAERRRQAAAQLFNRVVQSCAFYATLPVLAKTFCLLLPASLVVDAVHELRQAERLRRHTDAVLHSESPEEVLGEARSLSSDATRGDAPRDGEAEGRRRGRIHTAQAPPREGTEKEEGGNPEATEKDKLLLREGLGNSGDSRRLALAGERGGDDLGTAEKANHVGAPSEVDVGLTFQATERGDGQEAGRGAPAAAQMPLFVALVEAFDTFSQVLDTDRWLLSPAYEHLLAFWRRTKLTASEGVQQGQCVGEEKREDGSYNAPLTRAETSSLASTSPSSTPASQSAVGAAAEKHARVYEKARSPCSDKDTERANRRELVSALLRVLMQGDVAIAENASLSPAFAQQVAEGRSPRARRGKGDCYAARPAASPSPANEPRQGSVSEAHEEHETRAGGESERLAPLFEFLEDAAEARAGHVGKELKRRRLERCQELLEHAARPCDIPLVPRYEATTGMRQEITQPPREEPTACSGGAGIVEGGEAAETGKKAHGEHAFESKKDTGACPSTDAGASCFLPLGEAELRLPFPISLPLCVSNGPRDERTGLLASRGGEATLLAGGLGFFGDSHTHVLLLGASLAAGNIGEARRQLSLLETKTSFLEFPPLSQGGNDCQISKWLQILQPTFVRRLEAAGLLHAEPRSGRGDRPAGARQTAAAPHRELARETQGGGAQEATGLPRSSEDEREALRVLLAAFVEATDQAERCPRDKHRHGAALFRAGTVDKAGASDSASLHASGAASRCSSSCSSLSAAASRVFSGLSSSAARVASAANPCASLSPSPSAQLASPVSASKFPSCVVSFASPESKVLCGGRNFVLRRETKKKGSRQSESRRGSRGEGEENPPERQTRRTDCMPASEDRGAPRRPSDPLEPEGEPKREGSASATSAKETESDGKASKQKRDQKEEQQKQIDFLVIHAEVDCLSQVPPEAAQGAAVCIVELDPAGLGYEAAHPCPMCLQALQSRGVSRAFFTTPFGIRGSSIRLDETSARRSTPAPLAFAEEVLAARREQRDDQQR
ncbi:hypothetical protein BESB_079190 [Besnoitia besnoiti]|uniref:Cytidine and deoxycytidylate deaminase zinc-binding region domain-containing protein n=1 Tax=Besnoitia besnoiti TaxID=94643 RepID=A0A2A9MDE1_BESBE|nr:hypothetical protein BESB_079190 [Besnoitia besnoiti]PFH33703.1 hypothetical protein BESB_079190 [Besnoitia besnoiti]